jgi:DNA polymerase-3 subunit chi
VAEVWFYHLETRTLEQTLPTLLERSLDRDWTVVVESTNPERVKALDDYLWTYSDESFLPHGTLGDGDPSEHPILLVAGPENPAGAQARFLIDGADAAAAIAASPTPYERIMLLFDGRDAEAVAAARGQWKGLKDAGHAVAYWRQNEDGRWEKKA